MAGGKAVRCAADHGYAVRRIFEVDTVSNYFMFDAGDREHSSPVKGLLFVNSILFESEA